MYSFIYFVWMTLAHNVKNQNMFKEEDLVSREPS